MSTWRKRFLLTGILTTALTFTAGVTSTYAWLNLGQQTIERVIEAELSDHVPTLQMGQMVDGEFVAFTEKDTRDGAVLSPVSGAGSVVEGEYPVLTSAPRMKGEGTLTKDGYLQFEYYFLCDTDCWIYLAPGSHVVPGNNANRYDEETGIQLDEKKLDESVFTLRTRFTSYSEEEGLIDILTIPTIAAKEGQEVLQRAEGKDVSDVYYGGIADILPFDGFYDNDGEKEYVYHYGKTPTAEEEERLYKGIGEDENPMPEDQGNFLLANHRKGIKKADLPAWKEEGYVLPEDARPDFSSVTLEEGVPTTDSDYLLNLVAFEPGKLVVTVYLEGWDPYCTNDIGSASMELDLVFTGLAH